LRRKITTLNIKTVRTTTLKLSSPKPNADAREVVSVQKGVGVLAGVHLM
jgi:hypothetical protein